MKNRVCKLAFHVYGKALLDTFANGVKNGIFNNPLIFDAPPLTAAELLHLITDYNLALATYDANGKNFKTAYLKARTKLMEGLNQLANYVNTIANGDPSIITTSGFFPTAETSQASPVLQKIEIVKVIPTTVNGRVKIETPAIVGKGVSAYGLILVSESPLSMENFNDGFLNLKATEGQIIIVDFNRARKKIVNELDSTIAYYGYMFAVNATGVSPLSDAVRVKCI